MSEKKYGVLMRNFRFRDNFVFYIPQCVVAGSLKKVGDKEVFFSTGDFRYLLSEDMETLKYGSTFSISYIISEEEMHRRYSAKNEQEMKKRYLESCNIQIGTCRIPCQKIVLNEFDVEKKLTKVFQESHPDNSSDSKWLEELDGEKVIPFTVDKIKEILSLSNLGDIKRALEKAIQECEEYQDAMFSKEEEEPFFSCYTTLSDLSGADLSTIIVG